MEVLMASYVSGWTWNHGRSQYRAYELTKLPVRLNLLARGVILINASLTRVGQRLMLGPLEIHVMEVLWDNGESSVRDVVDKLNNKLAYTTVMTTLDRLFKKGLLDRQKSERAFLYSARLSSQEWERRRAGDLVAGFLAGPEPSRDLLLSSLVDAVGQHDAMLLDELEEKIRRKREELNRVTQA
jgi:predicted transcriptional regulator